MGSKWLALNFGLRWRNGLAFPEWSDPFPRTELCDNTLSDLKAMTLWIR